MQSVTCRTGARADAECTPTSRPVSVVGSDTRRLRNDLLCAYDKLIIQPHTAVEVTLYIYRLHLVTRPAVTNFCRKLSPFLASPFSTSINLLIYTPPVFLNNVSRIPEVSSLFLGKDVRKRFDNKFECYVARFAGRSSGLPANAG